MREQATLHLHLVIPALFGPGQSLSRQGGERVSAPALETLLSRARSGKRKHMFSLEGMVFSLFEIDAPANADLPIAAVTRVLDMGVIDKGWWLRADPIHLRPHQGRLILADAENLKLTQDEANQLAVEIMEAYDQDGWVLKTPKPDRWYLKPPRAPRIITTPLPDIVGHDIHPYLPRGKEGMAWHAILNEIQILLHTAQANQQREQSGNLSANSLWFWGGGRLPKLKPVAWKKLWSEEPVSLALARLAEVPAAAIPHGIINWQSQRQDVGDHLVIFDQGRIAANRMDGAAWIRFVDQLETLWIQPLFDLLKQGEVDKVTLYTDAGWQFEVTPRLAKRWWRRRQSLLNYH
jgi:hypothetical protein